MRGGTAAVLGRIDQYELLRELGGGGFGTVYLAQDTVSGVEVAVKGLPPLVKNNKEELENIRRNFALVSRLTHENIAKALVLHPVRSVTYADKKVAQNLRVQEGDTLMVMDYAPGITLSSWRKQFADGRVPLAQTVEIVRQIASALDYAHAQRIVHRDIKPSNVMIDSRPDGSLGVSVLDFGLAAEIRSSMSRVSMLVTDMSGTRPYMAPEQWQGRRQGEATDQYALAALTYELLTGDVPFASVFATGDPAVMMNVVGCEPPEFPDDMAKGVRNALSKALAKKIEDRFGTCGDFVKALEGRMKAAPRRGGWASPRSFLCLLAFLALAGGGFWLRQEMKAREEKRRDDERRAFRALREETVRLKARAELAYEDAKARAFESCPDLSGLLREFNRHYRTGMAFFASTNYVAATNAFVRLGVSMKTLVAEKKRLDEIAARRAEEERLKKEREAKEAERRRLEGLGYVIKGEAAVWEAGRPHRRTPLLVSDATPETWRAVKAGWKWDGAESVTWCAGQPHPARANWISSSEPDRWRAKPGYRPSGETGAGLPALVWTPGLRYEDFRTAADEGGWERLENCRDCQNGRVKQQSLCSVCRGTGRTSEQISCVSCGGQGTQKISQICGGCNGGRQKIQDCSAAGSPITRNGSILYRHGNLCSTCSGKGQIFNTAGVLSNVLIAGFSKGRYSGNSSAVVTCSSCSGLGAFMCTSCNGTGKVISVCDGCSGTGMVPGSRSCAACNGSGKTERAVLCGNCRNGSVLSERPCGVCNGTSRVWRRYGGGEPRFNSPPETVLETE